MKKKPQLCAGEWVVVRSREKILSTLDLKATVDNLPFMPEMFKYCGQQFEVFKRAHKTCDPPNGLGSRHLRRTVHLKGVRCDGQAHGGCQAECLLFWKDIWLIRIKNKEGDVTKQRFELLSPSNNSIKNEKCNENGVWEGTRVPDEQPISDNPTYICQSTQVSNASEPWHWWDPRQYFEDYTSGNVRPLDMLSVLFLFIYSSLAGAGIGFGSGMRWIYDLFQKLRGGVPYPFRSGRIRKGTTTPKSKLNIQSGEVVRVKSYSDILKTLDDDMRNRGMYFDAEMVPFAGKLFRVLKRIEKIIDEKTGKLITIGSDAVVLENVTCQARYSRCRKFCSRSIYPFWREIWLERAGQIDQDVSNENLDRPDLPPINVPPLK